jgi:hypothetical protein
MTHQKEYQNHKRRRLSGATPRNDVISISSDEDSFEFLSPVSQSDMKKPSLNSREIPEILDSSDDEIIETTPKKQKLSHETVPIKEDPDASSHQSTSAPSTPGHSTSTTIHSPSTSQTQTPKTPTPRLTSSNDTSQGEISEKILVLMKGLGKGFINQDEYSKLFAIITDPTNQWRKALLHGLLLMEQLLETDQGKHRWELSGAKLVRSIID